MAKQTDVTVTKVPLLNLVPDNKNARKHDGKNLQAIKKSIETFGAGRSLVVDGGNVVRAGNGTLEAALEAGVSEAVVVDVTGDQLVVVRRKDWSEQQGQAYGLADNKATDMSEFDEAVVRDLMLGLEPELQLATGFNESEIGLLTADDWSPTVETDDTAETPAKTKGEGEHHHLAFSEEMWITVNLAIAKIRQQESDAAISGSRAIELICGDYLSS